MPNMNKKIYRKRNPVKIILLILLGLVIAAVILVVSVFFGFKKYIVYTDDGIHLEVPMLQENYVSDTVLDEAE